MKVDSKQRSFLAAGLLPFFLLPALLSGCKTAGETLESADEDLQVFFGTAPSEEAATAEETTEISSDLVMEPADPADAAYAKALAAAKAGDTETAMSALEQAVALGHLDGTFELAEAHRKDLHPEADLEEAHDLYLGAATQGHAGAQFQLAELYANGRGVAADLSWAQRWYGRAAQQGYAAAQYATGVLLALGRGRSANREEAYGWLLLAEAGGHADAREARENLGALLGPSGEARGRQRAPRLVRQAAVSPKDRASILYLQFRLAELGYDPGPEDGLLGSRTKAAAQSYRNDRDIAEEDLNEALLDSLRV